MFKYVLKTIREMTVKYNQLDAQRESIKVVVLLEDFSANNNNNVASKNHFFKETKGKQEANQINT